MKFGRKFFFLLFCIEALLLIIILLNFKLFCQISKIYISNPFATFFTGGLMEILFLGMEIENLLTSRLSQIISEPTNFEPNKNPSCIDLIITDQPNIILSCGTRASLDSYCHHQIIYCKLNFRIPPPPFERKIWHLNKANKKFSLASTS